MEQFLSRLKKPASSITRTNTYQKQDIFFLIDFDEKGAFLTVVNRERKKACSSRAINAHRFHRKNWRQAAPMTRVTESRYFIYRVNAADKELQRLVSTDSVLRQYMVRAENYLLLVKEEARKEVIERVKGFGYLL